MPMRTDWPSRKGATLALERGSMHEKRPCPPASGLILRRSGQVSAEPGRGTSDINPPGPPAPCPTGRHGLDEQPSLRDPCTSCQNRRRGSRSGSAQSRHEVDPQTVSPQTSLIRGLRRMDTTPRRPTWRMRQHLPWWSRGSPPACVQRTMTCSLSACPRSAVYPCRPRTSGRGIRFHVP